jgi:hypothetical protein
MKKFKRHISTYKISDFSMVMERFQKFLEMTFRGFLSDVEND